MRFAICLFIGYLLAVPMTSLVSLDLRETEWANILTYFWILFGWIIWGGLFFGLFAIIAAWADR